MNYDRVRKTQHVVKDKTLKAAASEDKLQLCVWINAHLHRKFKSKLAARGETITEVIADFVQDYVTESKSL